MYTCEPTAIAEDTTVAVIDPYGLLHKQGWGGGGGADNVQAASNSCQRISTGTVHSSPDAPRCFVCHAHDAMWVIAGLLMRVKQAFPQPISSFR